MTMLMDAAEARLSASVKINSSIKFSFPGSDVDWITYTSHPRTLYSILICVFPSLNFVTVHFPKGTPICSAISSANFRFELRVNSCKDLSLYPDDISEALQLIIFSFWQRSLLYSFALTLQLLKIL